MKATFKEYQALNKMIKGWDAALEKHRKNWFFDVPFCYVCGQRRSGCIAKTKTTLDCLFVRYFHKKHCSLNPIYLAATKTRPKTKDVETAIKVLRQIRSEILDDGFYPDNS